VWAATEGYVPPRRPNSAHPSIVPFQNFATADGWIVVACPKQKFWESLCGALGRPGLAADERFADFAARDRNRGELLEILDAAFLARGSVEWLELLAVAGVPSAPVNDVAAALEDPQTQARGAVVEIEHPHLGTVRQPASPLRLGDDPLVERAPFRGEHTAAVLGELCGYAPERLAGLAAAGVFGEGYSITEATSADTSSPKSRATR
jgi:crotonobetainyl-CoA:carnitine CoA-transferase CaiB-like acyl-CoA transferase